MPKVVKNTNGEGCFIEQKGPWLAPVIVKNDELLPLLLDLARCAGAEIITHIAGNSDSVRSPLGPFKHGDKIIIVRAK